MPESQQMRERIAVVAEARSWLGTPYHHMGRLKGPQGGVDCAQLIWAVFFNCGLTPFLPLEPYPPDFMLHRGIERYMNIVIDRAQEVADPKPADVVLYKIGRVFAHGGIVVDPGWPAIIHANHAARAVVPGRGDEGRLARVDKKFFSRW
jgi:cell wall-associated NlpC family hydrolase